MMGVQLPSFFTKVTKGILLNVSYDLPFGVLVKNGGVCWKKSELILNKIPIANFERSASPPNFVPTKLTRRLIYFSKDLFLEYTQNHKLRRFSL